MDMPTECVPAVRAGGRDAHARACQCRQHVFVGSSREKITICRARQHAPGRLVGRIFGLVGGFFQSGYA
jgi:hypothetical protein